MNIQQFLEITKSKWQKNFIMYVYSNECDIKMHHNLVTIEVMSYTLSKLRVDIKFDIFNMKPKIHLIASLLAAILYQGKHDMNHRLLNIASIDTLKISLVNNIHKNNLP